MDVRFPLITPVAFRLGDATSTQHGFGGVGRRPLLGIGRELAALWPHGCGRPRRGTRNTTLAQAMNRKELLRRVSGIFDGYMNRVCHLVWSPCWSPMCLRNVVRFVNTSRGSPRDWAGTGVAVAGRTACHMPPARPRAGQPHSFTTDAQTSHIRWVITTCIKVI